MGASAGPLRAALSQETVYSTTSGVETLPAPSTLTRHRDCHICIIDPKTYDNRSARPLRSLAERQVARRTSQASGVSAGGRGRNVKNSAICATHGLSDAMSRSGRGSALWGRVARGHCLTSVAVGGNRCCMTAAPCARRWESAAHELRVALLVLEVLLGVLASRLQRRRRGSCPAVSHARPSAPRLCMRALHDRRPQLDVMNSKQDERFDAWGAMPAAVRARPCFNSCACARRPTQSTRAQKHSHSRQRRGGRTLCSFSAIAGSPASPRSARNHDRLRIRRRLGRLQPSRALCVAGARP